MESIKELFLLDPDIVYLNHGSFGACPKPVFEVYQDWQRILEKQPVRFLSNELGDRLADARFVLGEYIHSRAEDVVFIPNATFGVNIIAHSLALEPGDEILTTDHEYGACKNTWEFICKKSGAKLIEQTIPLSAKSPQDIVEELWKGVTSRTKLIFMSHITSPTAVHFPVEDVCNRCKKDEILSMIDGAHAPGHIALNMESIGADFYIGNCHKWLMAPKGSAFLYTSPEKQYLVLPLIVSWGWGDNKSITTGSDYLDYLQWWGTWDPSAFLSVPAAIQFQSDYNWEKIKHQCHVLVIHALDRICDLVLKSSYYIDDQNYHQMAIAPLPRISDLKQMKDRLLNDYSIEIPCIEWNGKQFIRISIQGYNSHSDVDKLITALIDLLPQYSETN